jgi:uncharacterized protein
MEENKTKIVDAKDVTVESSTGIKIETKKDTHSTSSNSQFDSATTDQKFENVTDNSRLYSIMMHVGGIFLSFVPSLIIYLAVTDDQFLKANAKEALNFQINLIVAITVLIVLGIVSAILAFVVIGIFTGLLVGIAWFALLAVGIIFPIVCAIKSSNNILYKIPFIVRLIK